MDSVVRHNSSKLFVIQNSMDLFYFPSNKIKSLRYPNQNPKQNIVCKFGTQKFTLNVNFLQTFSFLVFKIKINFIFPGGRFIVGSNFKTKYHSLR